MSRFLDRAFAWGGGALFVASLAVTAWWYAFDAGRLGIGASAPGAAILSDVALFSAFALHHSLFARFGVKAWLARVAPDRLLRPIYVWTASVLLIIVCVFWTPIGGVTYRAPSWLAIILTLVQLAGVVLIWRAVRAIDPLELAGIRATLEDTALQTDGPYRFVRHPLYLGWMLLVFGCPTMTGDRLLFATISSLYLVVAIPFEERALETTFGKQYAQYRQRVPWRVVPHVY